MQSSPPTRAWEWAASPGAESQYSIDLAAFDLDSNSGASTPLPKQHVDRVLSEDIDGPSDFTLNLEAWMRGGTMKKQQGSLRGGLQSLKAERKTEFEQNIMQNASHTPSNSPPRESVFNAGTGDADGEEGSSVWNPHAEAATPHPLPKKNFLQATVEDYHSELTPARLPSTQRVNRQSFSTQTRVASPGKSEVSTPGRPSSETVSPVRSPVLEKSAPAPRQVTSQTEKISFQEELRDMREKCERLEKLNSTLNQSIDEERRLRRQDTAAHETKMADASRRERDLTETKDRGHNHMEDVMRQLNDMKARLQGSDAEMQTNRKEMERLKQSHAAETQKLKQQLHREKMERGQEVRNLGQDLELARRGRDDAEESARMAREEVDEYRREYRKGVQDEEDELDRMRSSLREDGLASRVAELEEQLRTKTLENEKLKNAKRSAEETANSVRAEMTVLKQTQEEETSRLTEDHRRAVSLAENLQSKLKELRQQFRQKETKHDVEIKRLQSKKQQKPESSRPTSPHAEEHRQLRVELESKDAEIKRLQSKKQQKSESPRSTSPNVGETQHLRTELESKQTKFNSLLLERDELQDTLTTTETALAAAQLELSDLSAVNLAMDVKVSEALRKREAYWRGRLHDMETERAEWEKERKVMVKTLLRQWGREEVGVQEPRQGYEYAFKKRARGNSGTKA